MERFYTRVQWIVMVVFSCIVCPLQAEEEEGFLPTYDVVLKVSSETIAFGPATITVVPGFPARVSVSGHDSMPDLELRVLTNPYHLQAGGDAVMLDMMVLSKDAARWSVIGEPRLVLQPGHVGLVTVDEESGSVDFEVEISKGQAIRHKFADMVKTDCPSMHTAVTPIAAQNALTFSSGVTPLASAPGCCSSPCPNGGNMTCCGAVACCACGTCCETGADFYTQ